MKSLLQAFVYVALLASSSLASAGTSYRYSSNELERLTKTRSWIVESSKTMTTAQCVSEIGSLALQRTNVLSSGRMDRYDSNAFREVRDFQIPSAEQTCGVSYADFKAEEIRKKSASMSCADSDKSLAKEINNAFLVASLMFENTSSLQDIQLTSCR